MRACWLKWVGRDWSISADYIWLKSPDANNAIYRAILNNRKDARGSYRKEVMDYLHLMAPNKRQADPRFIRFKNGVLDIDTGQLVDNP